MSINPYICTCMIRFEFVNKKTLLIRFELHKILPKNIYVCTCPYIHMQNASDLNVDKPIPTYVCTCIIRFEFVNKKTLLIRFGLHKILPENIYVCTYACPYIHMQKASDLNVDKPIPTYVCTCMIRFEFVNKKHC
jgi:hypothetical protein